MAWQVSLETGASPLADIEHLLRAGELDAASARLAHLAGSKSADQTYVRYLQAVILKKEGSYRRAIRIFREILAQYPQFQRVRLNLAHALYLTEQDEGAKHHFNLVRSAATNPEVVAATDHFLDAIDKRKRWTATGYITLAPSSNVNQGTSDNVVVLYGLPFVISDHAKAKSGLGVAAGGTLGLRIPVASDLDIDIKMRGHARRYEQKDFNTAHGALTIGPRWRFDRGHFALKGLVERRWSGDHGLNYALGGRAEGFYRLAPGLSAHAFSGCYITHYEEDWRGRDMRASDGHTCDFDLYFDKSIASNSFVRLLLGGEEHWSKTEFNEYGESYVGIGAYKELPFGITLYGEGRARRRHYDEPSFFFNNNRDDRTLEATLQLTKRDFEIFGVAPRLSFNFAKRFSNQDVYQYTSHGIDLTFTRAF